jgi:hypothetical protein
LRRRRLLVPYDRPAAASYTQEKMERQWRKGNVAEALFRLWVEDHSALLPRLAFVQQGYNPAAIVPVEAKRESLKRQSDPDFAAIYRVGDVARYAAGISVNGQKAGYTARSTMGGLCILCNRGRSCLDGHEANLWYNRYNIVNDYRQFRERMNGVDVALVTLLLPSSDTIFGEVKKRGWEALILDYIRAGRAGIAEQPQAGEMLHYLGFGARGRIRRRMEIRFTLHSELETGTIPQFITGGISQYGRPREVCCVDIRHSRGEDDLLAYLSRL